MRDLTGDILLEAGTNESEVLVFRLGDQRFGVNVAKVREVLQPLPVVQVLHKHRSVLGFIHLRGTTLTLIALKRRLSSEQRQVSDAPIDTIVSDIEMPRMDGLHLTKLIMAGSKYRDVPVALFSSLISKDNANKGLRVGTTAQIPSPDPPEMVQLVDRIISGEALDQTNVGEVALQSA